MIVLNVSDRYLDDHELWTSTDFAVHCFKLIVNNVQVTCKYSVSVKSKTLDFLIITWVNVDQISRWFH